MNPWKLVVLSGPDGGSEYMVSGVSTVGRSSECTITVNDKSMSRQHFEIDVTGSRPRVRDIGSSNGTFVDGRLVSECELESGIIICAGASEYTLIEYYAEAHLSGAKSMNTTAITSVDAVGRLFSNSKNDRDLIVIYKTARHLPLCTSLSSLGEALLKPLCSSIGGDGGSIFLLYPNDKLLEAAHWSSGKDETIIINAPKDLLESVRSTEKGYLHHYENGETAIAVPLSAQGKILGILYIARLGLKNGPPDSPAPLEKSRTSWDDRDLSVALAIGEVGGPALSSLITKIKLFSERGRFHRTLRETTGIIGNSESIKYVTKMVSKVAPANNPVLILGETGTGKELIAKAIHYNGPRAGNPMISVNCAALVTDIAESELFGHIKGAFTGATCDRKGRFELANSGTLFLDEVGELSPAVQAKLLRVLETGTFTPVGSTKERTVNIRIIGATNRDLNDEVAKGRFRKDLYFRLNSFPLNLPPLRERREDIPDLVNHFLRHCAMTLGFRSKPTMPANFMDSLVAHNWPGNVRELANVIERCVVLSENEVLSEPLLEAGTLLKRPAEEADSNEGNPATKDWTLEMMEAVHIEMVLKNTQWNKKKTAMLLGIERATLYSKIEKYGLKP
jgi:transcriptional regulator with GAF, ATPase, and Fis domain/pSer/pThr/pTyr-binding forkhead associated (FHA) protein